MYMYKQKAKEKKKKGNEIANLLDVVGDGGGGKTQVEVMYISTRVGPAIP